MGVPRGAGPLLGPTLCCCLLLLRLCGARPGDHCRTIDCMLHRREHCASGSDVCGPCLQGFTDTGGLTCEDATQKEKDTIPKLDQEIDKLASILSRQGSQSLQLADAGNKATSSESPPPPPPPNVTPSGRNGEQPRATGGPQERRRDPLGDGLLLGVVIACAVSGLVALLVAGICWCSMRREMKLAAKADYPAFKSSSPPPYDKISPGDKKLAQNAQMYHYQHQKQQMLSMEKNKDEPKHTDSAVTSDEENEDGDYTVYECPGLAPTGEMEVKNPLFDDSSHQPAHKAT